MANIINDKVIDSKKNTILTILANGGTYTDGVKAAVVSLASVTKWRKEDIKFDDAINAILQERKKGVIIDIKRELPSRNAADLPLDAIDETVDELCKAIRSGLPVEYCCLLVNISRDSLDELMCNQPDVCAKINKAQAQNLLWWVSKIRQGAEKDWRAAISYLERVYPMLFAEVKAIDASCRVEKPKEPPLEENMVNVTPEFVVKKLTEMTDEELERLVKNSI